MQRALCGVALMVLAELALGGVAPTAGERVAKGEAIVWYLGHCGYAVRTANHLLIFDYIELEESPTTRGMAIGFIDATEIKDLAVRVFVSHSHVDHYDPLVLDWQKSVRDIRYFFGWQAMAGDRYNSLPGPRSSVSVPGMEVFTVNSRHSGVDEVAFLVKVDGLVVFHGGDYQGRMARGAASSAVDDMRYLRTIAGAPDLMFLGAWTGDPYPDIIRGLQPKVIFPGHSRKKEAQYRSFAADLKKMEIRIPVPCPTRRGDHFRFRNGVVQGPELP
jgi:hypothetical protein